MKSLSIKQLIFLLLCVCWPGAAVAQSLDQAKKLYNDGHYEEAKPAFEKLVKQSPNNSSYNLWYGVCCYETDDWENAEKYLLIAGKRNAMEAYRYLTDIYSSSYRFDEAIEMLESYIESKTKKKEDVEAYKDELKYLEKLQRMKEKTEDVQIIDSVVVDKQQILSVYFLSEDCGTLETYGQFFTSLPSCQSTVYVNSKGDMAYYARPDNEGRYVLCTQSKLLDAWADEKQIFATDSADNNYPFLLGDGLTLYFASEGHGSVGGYDLFVTRYHTGNGVFLAPEQLGMPFNSPANDYLLVVDEAKGLGWFASDRNQPEGKVCIYLFIPDASRKRLPEDTDDELMRRRARLSSIRDSWVSGADYNALIALAHTQSAAGEKKIERDFEFIVNDGTTYYRWNDFRSSEAKSFYEKAIELKKQIRTLEESLDKARQSYSNGNAGVRNQLTRSILQYEVDLKRLLADANEWEKKARNTENVRLRN